MTIHQTPGDRHRIPRNNIYAFKCTIKLNKPHTWCWFDKNKESNQTNAIEIKFYFRLCWTHVGILTRMCDSRCFSLFLGICLYFQAFEKGFTTFRLSVGYYPWVTKYFFSDSFYSIPCRSLMAFVFICLFELRNCDDESMLPNNRQLHIDTMEIIFRHSQSANPDAYKRKGCKYPNVYQTIAKFVLEEKGIQIKWITNNCSSWDCLLNCHGFTVRFSVYLIQSHNSFRYVCIVARFVAAACRLWVSVFLWAINVCECLSMVMLFQSAT